MIHKILRVAWPITFVLIVALVIIAAFTSQAENCRVFAQFDREQGSRSMFPERPRGQAERVTFLDCGGVVHVRIEPLGEVYKK
jgi:hypothetical protein